MTTEDTTTAQAHTGSGTPPELMQTADWFTAPDYTLQRITNLVDRAGHDLMTVKLLVPGATITGTVAPADSFYDWVVEQQTKGTAEFDDGVSEETEQVLDFLFGQPAAELRAFREADEPSPPELVRYIHLRDAQVRIGQSLTDVGFIRVLLSQVSSWTI
ncbi:MULTISPECIES: hypothetical protein [Rhodococcus]|uniref:hypothetical protein n=1 Tax=Rhodococcus TaxID=1827 RepID=UPI0011AB4CC2|nr:MULTISPECIES: hypothetical protein [Rhodococcus]